MRVWSVGVGVGILDWLEKYKDESVIGSASVREEM